MQVHDVEEAQRNGEHEHEDRQRRGHAEVGGADTQPVDVGAEQVGGGQRGAGVLQHADLGEHAQVPDHLQQGDDHQHRPDHRHRDGEEPLPGRRTVQRGGLQDLLGDLGEPGVDGEGDERHRHPDHDHGGDEVEAERLLEPVVVGEVEPELGECPVDDAAVPVEQPDPHRHGRDHRHRPGQQHGDLQDEPGDRADGVHQEGDQHPDDHGDGGVDEAEGDRAADHGPGLGVGEQLGVVGEPDELRRLAELLGEAELLGGRPELPHQRVAEGEQQDGDRRHDQEVRHDRRTAVPHRLGVGAGLRPGRGGQGGHRGSLSLMRSASLRQGTVLVPPDPWAGRRQEPSPFGADGVEGYLAFSSGVRMASYSLARAVMSPPSATLAKNSSSLPEASTPAQPGAAGVSLELEAESIRALANSSVPRRTRRRSWPGRGRSCPASAGTRG